MKELFEIVKIEEDGIVHLRNSELVRFKA